MGKSAHGVIGEAGSVDCIEGEGFIETRLYLGRSLRDGGAVDEFGWNRFLKEAVTPAFPAGFTVLHGQGQYRGRSGRIVSENTAVLVLIHRDTDEENRKADSIRREYIRRFDQEAVLKTSERISVEYSLGIEKK